MMDACLKYHETANGYREAIRAAWQTYENVCKRLETYSDSKGAASELRAAQDARDEAIRAAQGRASHEFDSVLAYMREAVEHAPMAAPTQEQMAIVSALSMRENVTADELRKAGEQLRGVDVAVAVLDEIAQKNGYPGIVAEFMGATGRASRAVAELTESARLMVGLTRPDGVEARHRANHYRRHGGEFDKRHEGVDPFGPSSAYGLSAVDRDFTDERETMRELGGVGNFTEFRSIVNNSPTIKPGLQEAWGEV